MFLFIFFLAPIDIASTNAFDKALEAPRRTRCWDRGIVPAPKIVINLPMTYKKISGLEVRDIIYIHRHRSRYFNVREYPKNNKILEILSPIQGWWESGYQKLVLCVLYKMLRKAGINNNDFQIVSTLSKHLGGRGHWAVYYSSPESFIITFSHVLAQHLWGLLLNFDGFKPQKR